MFNLASTALRCGQFQQVQKLEEEVEYKVYSIAFSPDGQRLASGGSYQSSDNKGIIQIWEVDGQGQFQQIQKLEDDVGYKVYSIAFSPDNRRLASGGYYRSSNNTGRIQIWEVDGQGQFQQIQKFEDDIGYKVYSIAFSPDNRRLASGGYYRSSSNNTGRIQIWEVDGQGQFQQIQKFEDDVVYSAYSIAFSPDNRRLASGGSNLGNKGIIQIWETDGQGQFQQIQKLEDDVEFLVYSIAFSPDNRRLASGSSKLDTKGRIQIWNADSSV
ncbi:WD40 repeat-like protein [Thozetella sp. PMI_491]|nr:WD40 repeat-like protein [Thozetella sp. PMI_491]